MANAYKNEKTIRIGEVEILLRPNFENLSSFESNVITLDEFSFRLVKGRLPSLSQMVQAIFYFQAEKKFNLEQINCMVQNDVGFQISSDILSFLSGCVAGYKNKADAEKSVEKALTESEKKS
jgi:queuine/archaeosine tRNA-ribosyltransferase